jgi:2-aminoadipate transaminase
MSRITVEPSAPSPIGSPIWYTACLADLSQISVDHRADAPVYKQLADGIRSLVDSGVIQSGEKLPATRELAGHLGLNRTTVAAAYAVLEQSGILQGHVGRGSFIANSARSDRPTTVRSERIDWESLLPPLESIAAAAPKIQISFANSRPAQDAFPLACFRRLTKDVIDGEGAAQILQLGSPHGYAPLRRYLLEQAVAAGIARPSDDLIITNGCQQALDLLARLFFGEKRGAASGVAMEDPVYHGLVRVFTRAGAHVIGVPIDADGLDPAVLEEALQQYRPRLLVVTPSFQNPTGATLPLERRKRIIELAQRYGAVLVENDIYSELRYRGAALPTLKELDESGNTILLRSYSKVSFPGLRVGWAIAPQPVIARLAEAKQWSDLHSDQLSQAVLLRFAESGELERHLERTRAAGAEKLNCMLEACARCLPPGSRFTRPTGGMSLWIEMPAPLLTESLLRRAAQRGIDFLPGRYFSARRPHVRAFRLSFGGLSPTEISRGLIILGEVAHAELTSFATVAPLEPVAALV